MEHWRFAPSIAHRLLGLCIMGSSHRRMHPSHWFFGRFELQFNRLRDRGLVLNRFNGFAENLNGWWSLFRGFSLNAAGQYDFTNWARLVRQTFKGLR